MAFISVTNTFTNGTLTDAPEMNTNFTDIINGTKDGTKDFSISALTVAGALTANGNCTLGNASADDITVTGSLASSIPIKTTFSYDIGSGALGIRDIFFGSADSAAFSTKIRGGTVGANRTLTLPTISMTLPTADGAANDFMVTDASGVMSFKGGFPVTSTDSTGYTVTTADKFHVGIGTTDHITFNMYTTSGNSGRFFLGFKKGTGSNICIFNPSGSEQINGGVASWEWGGSQGAGFLAFNDGTAWYGGGLVGAASMIRLHTLNGFGSTNTKIRRFTTTVTSTGQAISYADSAANGASFTIKVGGLYYFTYTESTTSQSFFGLSLNSTQLATDLVNITTADRVIVSATDTISNAPSTCTAIIKLGRDDVVRPHSDAVATGIAARCVFIACQVGT